MEEVKETFSLSDTLQESISPSLLPYTHQRCLSNHIGLWTSRSLHESLMMGVREAICFSFWFSQRKRQAESLKLCDHRTLSKWTTTNLYINITSFIHSFTCSFIQQLLCQVHQYVRHCIGLYSSIYISSVHMETYDLTRLQHFYELSSQICNTRLSNLLGPQAAISVL